MMRTTNFVRATAAVCGAFLFVEAPRTEAASFKIRELKIVGSSGDIRSDPSVIFDPEAEILFAAFIELGPIGLLCAVAEFEANGEEDDDEPFLHIRYTDPGSWVNAQIPVNIRGHSAIRVGSNNSFVANELMPSMIDPAKLDLVVRSAVQAAMSDRLALASNGSLLFAAGTGQFGGFSSIHLSTPGAAISTSILDNSGAFDIFYPPSSNQLFSKYVFAAYQDDNTGGFWSVQGGITTPIIDSNHGYAAFGDVSVNDKGQTAFRAIKNGGVEVIARFRNNAIDEVISTAGVAYGLKDPSINNRNEIAAGAIYDDFRQGVYFMPVTDGGQAPPPNPPPGADSLSALPSPTPIAVIEQGQALSGSTVATVSVGTQALTDRSEIIFRATLADGRKGIYFATPKRSALLNISTRLRVLTGENVLIGGFIVTGSVPKKVIVRGIGPSLSGFGVAGALADPKLELHQGSATLATNNNWKIKDSDGTSQEAEIQATGLAPSNDNEAALVATLPPGAYTAILLGTSNGTGVGLVEVYDLDQGSNAQAGNISTRGFVDTGDNVMIGGLIAGPNDSISSRILIRALGPSLQNFGVTGALANPFLELHDASGATLATNDNWKVNSSDGSSQQAQIEATMLQPSNDLESALVASLPPGNYTAIVRGTGNSSGVGLVEFYNLK